MDNKQKSLVPEEIANSITHGIGVLLSIIGLIFLIINALTDTWKIVSFSIFGATMILLYLASTLYHAFSLTRLHDIFQKLDHAAIYLLIAGTYTPFTLVSLRGPWGWTIFGIIWALAIAGIIYKLGFYREKHNIISTILYVAMGWLGIMIIRPLWHSLSPAGVAWLIAGGVSYSAGVIFYLWEKLRFSHAIWHLFVLGGTACHFVTVLGYV